MLKDIVVFGAGGFGREIMEALCKQNLSKKRYNILGFVDDNKEISNTEINFFSVIGTSEFLLNSKKEIEVLICLGEASIRKKVVEKLSQNPNIKFPNFICEDLIYSQRFTKLGRGNIIYYKNILSVNIEMGDFNYINSSCSISHDVCMGDFVTISPSATICGNVCIGNNAYIGAGVTIREGREVGENTIVGMGSVITKSIPANVVAYGTPCTIKRKRSKEERVFG